jgi:hypothetical protein
MIEYEHYGESLDSTPDFLFMKKHYEESVDFSVDMLEEQTEFSIFVDPSNILENLNNKQLKNG